MLCPHPTPNKSEPSGTEPRHQQLFKLPGDSKRAAKAENNALRVRRGPENSEEEKTGFPFAAEMGEFHNDVILVAGFPQIITLPHHLFPPTESRWPGLLEGSQLAWCQESNYFTHLPHPHVLLPIFSFQMSALCSL